MNKKRVIMAVMNALDTDARVQRAAKALEDLYDLTLIGVGKGCGEQSFDQVVLDINNRNGVLRFFDYVNKIKKYLKNDQFDVFYAHDYFSAALVSWVRRRFPKTVIVYDSHELIFPALGFSQSKRDAFFSHFEKEAIKNANLVICASDERASLMKDYYHMSESPLVIENISQLPIVEDEISQELLHNADKIIKSPEVILVYAGVLSPGRKIDSLIDIVAERPDTKLLIIGGGPDRERLESIATEKIADRFHFTGSVPYKYMGILLNKCDVGYISYPTDSLNNTYCASNKIYEYASVNLPMIAPENPTIRKLFEEYSIGVIGSDLGQAFDEVRYNIQEYKKNCARFTEMHPWSRKATILTQEIESLIK